MPARERTVVKLWSTPAVVYRSPEFHVIASTGSQRLEIARERLFVAAGQDLGDELRRLATTLAYQAAKDYELALRRVENELVTAVTNGRFSQSVKDVALDVIRTHMARGLMRAQLEAGDHMAFWVQR